MRRCRGYSASVGDAGQTAGRSVTHRAAESASEHTGRPAQEVADEDLGAVWSRVDALIDQAQIPDLVAHRMHLYAAWRRRAQGRPVDSELIEFEREAATMRLTAPALLHRVRAGYDGIAVLLKGADVAGRYPAPGLRPSVDLDVLVPDPEAVHTTLQRVGFRTFGMPFHQEHHHLAPLQWPGLPMFLELHRAPSWPEWLASPPPRAELFDAAERECALGAGVLSLAHTHQVLLLAAHAWRGAPFEALGHLIDIVVTRQGVSADDLATQAHAWGVDQLWRNTAAAIDQILTGGGGRALASLTRNFDPLRERSVVEAKLAELAAPFYGLPTRAAARATVRQLAHELQRDLGESRRHKLVRTATAIHQIFRPRSERDKFLRREAVDSKRGPTGGATPE